MFVLVSIQSPVDSPLYFNKEASAGRRDPDLASQMRERAYYSELVRVSRKEYVHGSVFFHWT